MGEHWKTHMGRETGERRTGRPKREESWWRGLRGAVLWEKVPGDQNPQAQHSRFVDPGWITWISGSALAAGETLT